MKELITEIEFNKIKNHCTSNRFLIEKTYANVDMNKRLHVVHTNHNIVPTELFGNPVTKYYGLQNAKVTTLQLS